MGRTRSRWSRSGCPACPCRGTPRAGRPGFPGGHRHGARTAGPARSARSPGAASPRLPADRCGPSSMRWRSRHGCTPPPHASPHRSTCPGAPGARQQSTAASHPRHRRDVGVVFQGRAQIGRNQYQAVHRHAQPGLQEVGDARATVATVARRSGTCAMPCAGCAAASRRSSATGIRCRRQGCTAAFRFLVANARAAEAGADRIDEHQVGEVQPGTRVVVQDRRRRRAVTLGAEGHHLGSDRAHVEVHRRRAGTAVEREGHRPVRSASYRR